MEVFSIDPERLVFVDEAKLWAPTPPWLPFTPTRP